MLRGSIPLDTCPQKEAGIAVLVRYGEALDLALDETNLQSASVLSLIHPPPHSHEFLCVKLSWFCPVPGLPQQTCHPNLKCSFTPAPTHRKQDCWFYTCSSSIYIYLVSVSTMITKKLLAFLELPRVLCFNHYYPALSKI